MNPSSDPHEDPNLAAHVNPFVGSETCDLKPAKGFASSWWTAKPPIGNTHPGATLPFGMISACPYSGAYVTGYGTYDVSLTGDKPRTIYDEKIAFGISHFQQSGTGRIRAYYNYFLTTPLTSASIAERQDPQKLLDESASPGHYQATLSPRQVKVALTASERGMHHLYTFDAASPENSLVVNVNSGGLLIDDMQVRARLAFFSIDSAHQVSGIVKIEGIHFFFTCICEQGEACLWRDDAWLEDETIHHSKPHEEGFGFGFRSNGQSSEMSMQICFSLQEKERTLKNCQDLYQLPLDAQSSRATASWNQALGKITIDGATKFQKDLFYTNLYRAQIKPANFFNENPFRPQEGPFFFDLSTLWDLYKTQLPLMFSLHPELGSQFVDFLQEVATREGSFPVSYSMDHSPERFAKQATGLCHMILEDARLRGIEGDWENLLTLMWKTSHKKDVKQTKFAEYAEKGKVHPLSHTLDISYAHFCTAQMARSQGIQIMHDESMKLVKHWKKAFDKITGLLRKNSEYYEGENWNYSFRFMHSMKERIQLAGGTERFIELLDTFFGFKRSNTPKFEGMNNEPDMETPYAYLYAGRHDRTAEIVYAALTQRYGMTPGGLAGNEDSGALSSWYVWSSLGIFPVTGQPVILIGTPLHPRAEIKLASSTFTIEVTNPELESPYIAEASLNGVPLRRAWLANNEFYSGGHLTITRSAEPSLFGAENLPPSFST